MQVELYERSNDLGGLVGSFDFEGHRVDRFYHVILPTDDRVRGLATELGLGEQFRFRPTGVGFYDDGRLFSMNSLREFLTFPLLAPHERLRLAAFVARCQRISSYDELDDVPLEEWLVRMCGRRVVDKLWRPLLDSKFDGRFDDLPATFMWARTKRMSKTRDKQGREIMGWLEGGYEKLIQALARAVLAAGGEIHTGTAVDQIAGGPNGACGLVIDGRLKTYDQVALHARPRSGAPAPRPGARRAGSRGALPLSRRRLPAAAHPRERQPLLHAEHHRPEDPADDDRRDDARRRSGARGRPPALRVEVRRAGPCRPHPARRRRRAGLSGLRADDLPGAHARNGACIRRPACAGRRARAPPRRRKAAAPAVPRAGAWGSSPRRTSIRRTSTGRP